MPSELAIRHRAQPRKWKPLSEWAIELVPRLSTSQLPSSEDIYSVGEYQTHEGVVTAESERVLKIK